MKKWFTDTVLALKLCPFAMKPWEEGRLVFQESPARNPLEAQEDFLETLEGFYEASPLTVSTILLGYHQWSVSFDEFLEFTTNMELLLEEAGLGAAIQLVTFHPQFLFEGLSPDDPSHWVNRSPIPVIHFLRSEELERAIAFDVKRAEEISLLNSERLAKLSAAEWKKYFPYKKAL